jgi:mono/diheme cytochrome c family protein
MMFDLPGVMALLALATLGTWLVLRARHARNRGVKWIGLVLSSLLALAATLATVVALVGFYKLDFPPHRPEITPIKVAGTPDQVARGAKFSAFCPICHSPNGGAPLVGQNFSEGGPPAGTLYAANLTPAGEIKDWSDGEVIRAIREGVHKNGRPLVIMPSEAFRNLSDLDVQAVVAYLRSQPAVEPATPPTRLNVIGALLIGSGLAQTSAQPPITHPIIAPAEGASAAYGQYLVSILACRLCHGENLTGGKSRGPGPPAGPNLMAFLTTWRLEDFVQTLRTGVDPYKHKLSEAMPWKAISAFATDTDLAAIYAYLHGLRPAEGATP